MKAVHFSLIQKCYKKKKKGWLMIVIEGKGDLKKKNQFRKSAGANVSIVSKGKSLQWKTR